MAQIAKELLCSKTAARAALIRAGIPIRKAIKTTGYGIKSIKGRPTEAGAERKVIETVIELRDGGMTFDKIAHFLTKMGVPTKTRRKKWNGDVCGKSICGRGRSHWLSRICKSEIRSCNNAAPELALARRESATVGTTFFKHARAPI